MILKFYGGTYIHNIKRIHDIVNIYINIIKGGARYIDKLIVYKYTCGNIYTYLLFYRVPIRRSQPFSRKKDTEFIYRLYSLADWPNFWGREKGLQRVWALFAAVGRRWHRLWALQHPRRRIWPMKPAPEWSLVCGRRTQALAFWGGRWWWRGRRWSTS